MNSVSYVNKTTNALKPLPALSFRGGVNSSGELQSDEFVKEGDDKKEKKNDLSTKAKIGIAGGIALAGTITFLIYKGRFSEAKKLAENIEFKPAQTVEEAIKFGKKHLGIKSYEGFENADLDAINWINQGITNVSNRMKGKLRMPKHIFYTDNAYILGENTLAGVISEKIPGYEKYYGHFYVNKNIFKNPDKAIEEYLSNIDEVVKFKLNEDGKWVAQSHPLLDDDSIRKLLNQFIKYKEGNFTFQQKLDFYSSLDVLKITCNSFNNAPADKIKQLFRMPEVIKACKENHIITDLEAIKNLSKDEQSKILNKIINLKSLNVKIVFDVNSRSAYHTIYHEMGHMQDMQPRCNPTHKFNHEYDKYPNELKDWIDNQEYIQTANRVSSYASTGPGEFIAETFADLIEGKKVPKEVLDLYKKLKGPMLPEMV